MNILSKIIKRFVEVFVLILLVCSALGYIEIPNLILLNIAGISLALALWHLVYLVGKRDKAKKEKEELDTYLPQIDYDDYDEPYMMYLLRTGKTAQAKQYAHYLEYNHELWIELEAIEKTRFEQQDEDPD
jgi:type III secretory pathway component EscR